LHVIVLVQPIKIFDVLNVMVPVFLSAVPCSLFNGFGGLEVACWPLVPKFAVSHLAEAVGFLG